MGKATARSGSKARARERKGRGGEPAMTPARRAIDDAWRKQHPELARAERALRVRQARIAEDWSHKWEGTPQTHAHAAGLRQGALARLYHSGAIDIHQMGWSQEIAAIHERICRAVSVRTASLETRIDSGRHGSGAFHEALGAVRGEMAYSAWRMALPVQLGVGAAEPVLAMICEDVGVTAAARRWRMRPVRARALLIQALDLWPAHCREARDRVDDVDLMVAHRRLA